MNRDVLFVCGVVMFVVCCVDVCGVAYVVVVFVGGLLFYSWCGCCLCVHVFCC